MMRFEDLIAEEARKIVYFGKDIARFDGFDDTLDAIEDEMRRTFEDILGDLDKVPASYNHTIAVLEGFAITTMRRIIKVYVHIDGVLDDLPTQRNHAIEQMEKIINDYSGNADTVSRGILKDLNKSYPDLRLVRELLETPGEDKQEPSGFPGFYKLNEEGTSLQKVNAYRRGWRVAVREDLGEGPPNDDLPQNRELRNRIYQAYTDDMFDAAEAADPERMHDFRKLKANYTRAMELIEHKFREEFVKKLVERAEKHPLLEEQNRKKQREEERIAAVPGFELYWLLLLVVLYLGVPVAVPSWLDMNQGVAAATIVLVCFSIIFFLVHLLKKLVTKYQLRKFDRQHPPPTDETDQDNRGQKDLAELIAEEFDFASPEWVEETAAFLDAQTAREAQRDAAATGLDLGETSYRAGIVHSAFVMSLGYMMAHWLVERQDFGTFFGICYVIFILFNLLNYLVKKYQLRRFDRNHPPPTEDTD